jgi:hypothetical protein
MANDVELLIQCQLLVVLWIFNCSNIVGIQKMSKDKCRRLYISFDLMVILKITSVLGGHKGDIYHYAQNIPYFNFESC